MFAPALEFLSDLAAHNDKAWFEANRRRYERDVKAPAEELVEALAPRIATLSPKLRAVPRGVGSSVSRINRDTRFSPDKSQYKDWVGIHFSHVAGKEYPGLHVHFSPADSGVGLGVWMLEPEPLLRVRQRIVAPGSGWAEARSAVAGGGCRFIGESLKNVPRGFPADHPYAEDLKRKAFGASHPVDPTRPKSALVDEMEGAWRSAWSAMKFLCDALDLEL